MVWLLGRWFGGTVEGLVVREMVWWYGRGFGCAGDGLVVE